MSREKPYNEKQRDAWLNTILLVAAFGTVAGVAPFVAGGYLLYKAGETAQQSYQSQEELASKATKYWQENGYDVLGFKSYEPAGIRPEITYRVKRRSDGKEFDGTAGCLKTCAMTKLSVPVN